MRPEQVLGLTFTNKAAAELARGSGRRCSAAPATRRPSAGDRRPTASRPSSTYHAYAGRLLREHGLRIGVEPAARLLADATRFQLAERVLRRARGPFVELDKTVSTLVGDLVQLDGELSEHLVTADDLGPRDAELLAVVDAVPKPTARVRDGRAYGPPARRAGVPGRPTSRAEKDRLGVLDFGDQLALAARLVARAPGGRRRSSASASGSCCSTSTRTPRSPSSVLLAGLFGGGHPVTAVGDPCQAIYGWRGASVGNIDDFPERLPARRRAPAPRYGLTRNNRSGERLLDLANALSGPLRARHPGVGLLAPRPEALGAGATVVRALSQTYAERGRLGGRPASPRLVAAGTPPGDVAVLVRARSDFPAYHDALVARGVPVEVVGLGGLLALPGGRRPGRDLAVLDDPTANAALVRLLAGPRWRIGPRDLALLGRRAAELVRGVPDRDADRRPDGAAPDGAAADEAAAGDGVDLAALVEELWSRAPSSRRAAARGGRGGRRPGRRRVAARGARAARRRSRTRRRPGRASPASRGSCASCAGTSASRCSTCCTGLSRTTGLDVEVAAAPAAARDPPRRRARRRSSTTRRRSPTSTATRACERSSRSCGRPTSSTAGSTRRPRLRATASSC